jgi:hypothetical protein
MEFDEDDVNDGSLDNLPETDRQFTYTSTLLTNLLDVPYTLRSILLLWKTVLFAETEEAFEKA